MPDSAHVIDRELSWLSFNERVLELAEDESVPLLERVRFLTIFASNLDEFYMVRVASVLGKIETNPNLVNSAGFTPQELLAAISERAKELTLRHANLFKKKIVPELRSHEIEIIRWDDLSDDERSYVSRIFSDRIFPVLTPLAVDPSHPFPYISGLSLNLAVIVKNPKSSEEYFARVKVPPILSRLVSVSPAANSKRFLLLEDLISIHLQELFP